MAGNHTLGTIRGTIEIDYDGAGIVKAVRDTEKAKSSMERLGSGSDKVLNAFGKFSRGAVALAGGIGTVYNALTLVTGALAVAGPLAAAGFAAAPGVILAYASVMGIAKIAVAGVGKALGAAGESSEKFEKAIEKLSPKAQAFARAFRDAYPQLVKIKNAMQDAFFNGSVGQVGAVVDRISQLKGVATGVAGELGRVARSTVEWATSAKSIAGMKTLLAGVQAFLRQIRASIGPVVQAFIGLGAQLGVFGATMGGAVNGALARFAEFLNGINLQEVFATALPIVKALGTFFGDVAEIAGHLFSMFNVDGANAVGILGELASKLADFLGSAEGQAALQALGQAIQAIAGAAGQIFLALLQALAPAIVALAPGVAQLAGQIAGVLVPAINALNPLLVALAGFLSDNMGWLGPLAGAVVAAAAAYKVYAAGVAAVTAAQAILQSKMLGAAAVWTAQKIAVIGSTAAQVANAAVTGGAAAAAWIANTAAVVANRAALLAGTIAMGVVRGAIIAWTAVQWLLNAALTANPIGLVVLAIAALVAGIIYAWKNSETFRNVVLAVWGAIKVAIAAVVNWITGTVWPSLQKAWQQLASGAQTLWGWIKTAWNGIKNAIQTAINAVSTVLRAVWNGIVNFVRGYINTYRAVITAGFNAAKNIINTVMNGVRNVVRSIWSAITSFIQGQINRVRSIINGIRSIINVVRSAFASAKSAAQGQINALVSLVRSLPGRAASALGNLGGMLYAKGQSLVRGFIDGIASMIGSVRDKAASVVSAVTDFLPGSPAKRGPLSGKGYVLLRARRFMNDFAQGMQDGSQKPVAALMGAVNPISRATVPSTSRTSSGASTAPSTPGVGVGNRTYQIRIGDKAFAELVTDAVTGNPVTVNKAASEGARRSAWAGSGR
jgi:phage-related protein